MSDSVKNFRNAVRSLVQDWQNAGLPSRQGLERAADTVMAQRRQLGVAGIWGNDTPVMVTATVDDGMGQGLSIIEKFADAIGIRIIRLGLMQPVDAVVATCHRHQPDYLGLTVLQFDTEDEIADIARALPTKTRIVAGGPVFNADPEFAARAGVHYAAQDACAFLDFMVKTAE
ncbi:cobalamin-dependent protein [Desulfosarcina sp. OttesenSCG-928-G10]|nr:cobalamin-dependent protein [Desulfosarcina sp. OttesenSCG-928-G10]MDL2320893.1 cobalamin-dependent protein [Desulfosarcina sp. OttesenSCG-928-B08]